MRPTCARRHTSLRVQRRSIARQCRPATPRDAPTLHDVRTGEQASSDRSTSKPTESPTRRNHAKTTRPNPSTRTDDHQRSRSSRTGSPTARPHSLPMPCVDGDGEYGRGLNANDEPASAEEDQYRAKSTAGGRFVVAVRSRASGRHLHEAAECRIVDSGDPARNHRDDRHWIRIVRERWSGKSMFVCIGARTVSPGYHA